MEILLYLLMSFSLSNSTPAAGSVGEPVGDLSFNTTLTTNSSTATSNSSSSVGESVGDLSFGATKP